jgi:hypothetical protein
VYLEEHKLELEQVQVLVTLETGVGLSTNAARPALTWVAFDTVEGETHIVPMTAVRRVYFRRRDDRAVGFTVTPVEQPNKAVTP